MNEEMNNKEQNDNEIKNEDRKKTSPPKIPQEEESSYIKIAKIAIFWVLLGALAIWAVKLVGPRKNQTVTILYKPTFTEELERGNIIKVKISNDEIQGEFKEAVARKKADLPPIVKFRTYMPVKDISIIDRLEAQGVEIKAEPQGQKWWSMLIYWLPMLLLIGFWVVIMRNMQGGTNKAFTFGKSRAKLSMSKTKVTFDDVAGADEAKQELEEIIEFLKAPGKFQRLGGKIPKGALLLGAPGTGKTLLARAVAGEADVPFFNISGSDFVEMFVGVGASRVRDLFEQGKKNAPCIIFIDEIDAVGRHRGAGLGGGHDEREQTLNQLLVEMDGFETNEGVILIAATNRPDVLDPALLRPGRFDRQIMVSLPDVRGRKGILEVHTRGLPLADEVDLQIIARGTPGLAGADLANIVNEAALLAARRQRDSITMIDFEDAKDKVLMGMERRSLVISDEEKKLIAYHETGHVLVAKLLPNMDSIHKVTIIPRGQALGLTQLLPVDEKHNYSKTYCLNILAQMLGGRAAEVIIFNDMTTGAGNDILRATDIARRMICEWGMSEILGPVTFGEKREQIFLGREFAQHRNYSEQTAIEIDKEIKAFIDDAFEVAKKILEDNIDIVHRIANALLERETLDEQEIDMLIDGASLEDLPPVRSDKRKKN